MINNPGFRSPALARIYAEEWKNLDISQQQVYKERYQILRVEYEKNMKEYENRYGPIQRQDYLDQKKQARIANQRKKNILSSNQ